MARQMKNSGVKWIGEIPEEWCCAELKHFVTVHNGKEIPAEVDRVSTDSYPVYGSGGVFKYTDAFMHDGTSVMFGRKGTLGKPIYASGKFWAVDTIYYLTYRTEMDARYNYYQLFAFDWNSHITQTALPSVVASEIVSCKFPIPSISEQREIALYLDRKCTNIDSVLKKTRSSIEEYKRLKQAVIAQAVTKGIRGERPMKDSGIDWLGAIPNDWKVYRIANLYDERSESGLDELPILTVSINTGVSDHEIADEDKDRIFVRCADRTQYKRVFPGDLTYNMMRAWQGAFGAVRVDGMVSPAYVVAKPKKNTMLDSRYMEALLRTPAATEEMHRYSRGIVDFRLRLYWPEFKNIRICLPPIEEQQEIAEYIDKKTAEIDQLIAKKKVFLSELEQYKKSLIYEFVTGKKEVPTSKPSVIAVNPILLKALLYVKTHELLGKNCRGRIQIQKMLYLIESMNDLNIGSKYVRQKYGPMDVDLDRIESYMEQRHWLKTIQGSPISYKKMDHYKEYRTEFSKYLAPYEAEIKRIIHFFENMNTSQAERFATLMAVWNDFILDGNANPSDEELIHEVITNWHPHKANYKYTTWQDTVNKMRANGIIPHGYGTHTILHQDNFLS